ncbi:hypothetical protein RclHR1_01570016 [Rhizophagus clarus]|uniref:Uncharacterized protein n=1 Tax=Rhizophagus clarus TaxID=94130 RepID=A0A2Z6QUZ4_9GLOM|nr:hypothetical protein RclHR1_01570016 [Rhizophagus clarus]
MEIMIQCFVAKIDAFIRGDPNNTFADALAPALDELPGDKGIRDMFDFIEFQEMEIGRIITSLYDLRLER